MEIEDFIIANFAIAVLVSFFLYTATNPLLPGLHVLETFAIGSICAYVFKSPGIF